MRIRLLVMSALFLVVIAQQAFGAAADPRVMKAMKAKREQAQMMAAAKASGKPMPASAQVSGQSGQSGAQKPAKPVTMEDVKKWLAAMQTSSTQWTEISDPKAKAYIVAQFIKQYQQKGITIKKPAERYVAMIDDMSARNPSVLSNSMSKILEVMAIMEYDFGNGQNKDLMAKRVLGETAYKNNKKRLGLA